MRRIIPLLVLFFAVFSSRAEAETWDAKGWVMLGERTVGGNVDRDRIDVGRHEGQFKKLNVVVLDSDLEMLDFTINFGDRTTYAPKLAHFFKEGQRTRSFELPPSAKVITHIDVKYRNLRGGGRARVQVWGWKAGDSAPVVTPAKVEWDSRGWQLLGERTVNGNVDRDRIDIGRYEGKFTKLQIVVSDSDLELMDFNITFGDRTTYAPKVAHFFKEGQRTRAFDLPPSARVISHIDVRYRNLPGGGRARLQVWGKTDGATMPTPTPATVTVPQWDQRGWQMLGERVVDGRVDNDRIDVGRYEGKFTKLQVVVLDSDLELIDFAVKFGRGAEWRPTLRHYFREGARTHAIDFPGDERTIKHVDFKYRNLPGGGRARLQVWGYQRAGDAPTQPPPGQVWDNRGWTMLGERAVQGGRRGDRDKIIVGRNEGKFRKLQIVVLDSDLELVEMSVKFGRGEPFRPEVNQFFREGTRTRAIDLPGDDRVIKWIEFRYRNLPGGGRAKIQVWAK